MYALGRECGKRCTMSRPPKNAMACSVEAAWQVPPPVPSTISPLKISNAFWKPLSPLRAPTTSLKLTSWPGSMIRPSKCEAATSMFCARGPWSPLREKYVENEASTRDTSMFASDARVTRGSTGVIGSVTTSASAPAAATCAICSMAASTSSARPCFSGRMAWRSTSRRAAAGGTSRSSFSRSRTSSAARGSTLGCIGTSISPARARSVSRARVTMSPARPRRIARRATPSASTDTPRAPSVDSATTREASPSRTTSRTGRRRAVRARSRISISAGCPSSSGAPPTRRPGRALAAALGKASGHHRMHAPRARTAAATTSTEAAMASRGAEGGERSEREERDDSGLAPSLRQSAPCEKAWNRMGSWVGSHLPMKACPQCNLRYPADALYCFLDGAELEAIRDPLIGTTIAGRYVVEEVIGRGGMATVYRARSNLGDRPSAIRIMSPPLAADPTVRERFRREARSAQTLTHPNVIEIFDHGETPDGTPYIVMELLDGTTLADALLAGAVAPARAVPMMIQLARGIARAHDLGVVHRDLKPENVFVCRRADGSDLMKILDFGIARWQGDPRLTTDGQLFGTPQYMAPERVSSGEAGPSVDLYALGVLFYEVVTARLPFDASDPTAFLVKHMNERPPPPRLVEPRVPPQLDALIMQLLEKEPRARPVDAHRVEQDLLALAAALGARVPPDPEKDPASSLPPALTAPTRRAERSRGDWVARVNVFRQMLASSRGGRGPVARGDDLERDLREMEALAADLAEVRRSSARAQRELEQIDVRGREGRQRFGFAVDALGLDTSRARD